MIWSGVDFDTGTVDINRTLVRVNGRRAAAEGDEEPGRPGSGYFNSQRAHS
ncbi:MAG: hypothetical protein M3O94_00520 [Actinomycetota bacterium]|nr:hypothetical protein [Actinomycetota bacterium]